MTEEKKPKKEKSKEDKPKNVSALRYNSLIRYTNKHTRKRYNQIKEERRYLELLLSALELQVAKDTVAIEFSKKNERQVLGWIV